MEAHDEKGKCEMCQHLSLMLIQGLKRMLNMKLNVEQFLKNSIFSAFMITNLINDILDLGKLENNAFQLNIEQFNLISVIEEAYQIISFQAENKNIKLCLSIDAQRPYAFKKVFSDRRRMLQILVNFISNSIKFTKKDGFIKVHLKVLEEQSLEKELDRQSSIQENNDAPIGKQWLVKRTGSQSNYSSKNMLGQASNEIEVAKYIKMKMSIEDNGVGISKTNIAKLFGNYSRLEEHQAMNHKGTGLGLSICKKIVEQMGGNVSVESEIGVGTKFHIEIALKALDKLYSSPASSTSDYKNEMSFRKQPSCIAFSDDFVKHFKRILIQGVSSQKPIKTMDFEFISIEEQQSLNQRSTNQHKEKLQDLKKRVKNYFEEDNEGSVSDCTYTALNESMYMALIKKDTEEIRKKTHEHSDEAEETKQSNVCKMTKSVTSKQLIH